MDPDTGLEESMWQLGLEAGPSYPERPGEPDCSYYVRTGSCGFGDRCRFNHPPNRVQVRAGGGDYPERTGEPMCQYYLRTGTCKYGVSCKYDHPRQGSGYVQPVSLNYYGFPLRPGEKECSYYMRTGQCKFGSTCKYHHPDPGGAFYPTVQAPALASWQMSRPGMMPTPYIQPPYGSLMISPGVVQVPSMSPYPPTVSPTLSPGGQHNVQSGTPLSSSAMAYSGPSQNMFPERPDQPECQYYMRTGECKFGMDCKYHHPPERISRIASGLNHLGLPLRPGAQPCLFYTQHGVCKFGQSCKYDHPMVLNYSPSASSLADMPVAPYPIGLSVTTLAPSSSSSDHRQEFISNKESYSSQLPSSESMPSGSVGSMFSMPMTEK